MSLSMVQIEGYVGQKLVAPVTATLVGALRNGATTIPSGTVYSTLTDAHGYYTLTLPSNADRDTYPPGTYYQVACQAAGYSEQVSVSSPDTTGIAPAGPAGPAGPGATFKASTVELITAGGVPSSSVIGDEIGLIAHRTSFALPTPGLYVVSANFIVDPTALHADLTAHAASLPGAGVAALVVWELDLNANAKQTGIDANLLQVTEKLVTDIWVGGTTDPATYSGTANGLLAKLTIPAQDDVGNGIYGGISAVAVFNLIPLTGATPYSAMVDGTVSLVVACITAS
jgi:hypothetical protein